MSDSIFEVVFAVGFVLGSVIRGVYTRGYRETLKERDRTGILESILVALSAVGLVVLPAIFLFSSGLDFAVYTLPAWSGWVGTGVFAAALWLLWRSHAELGLNWSPKLEIRRGHTLCGKGVFGYIRHPMYAAHLLWAFAQVLLLANWVAGPAFLVFSVPLYFVRIPREERMMIEEFGEEYETYMKRTGGILPRL
jgi:protein-S-isoprenylcysteine O-methyltransferase Ste14